MRDLTRELIYGIDSEHVEKIQAYELELNKGLPAGMPTQTLRNVPLKKLVVGGDDEILDAKVLDTVIMGAEDAENLWRQCAVAHQMTSEIERYPLITPDDFKFQKWTRGSRPRASGGSFWQVPLDCSGNKGLYGINVGLDAKFVETKGFDAVERALYCVGQSAGRLVFQAIITKYLADVATTMTKALATWDPRASGDDHYGALVGMEAGLAGEGFYPNGILVNPTEGGDLGVLDVFIRQDYSDAARGIPRDRHSIGNLYGRIPILRHRDVTTAYMIMAEIEKSMIVGLWDDLSIKDYEDVREGMEGAVCYIQFDVKSGKDAKGPKGATKPTAKAWAICTGA